MPAIRDSDRHAVVRCTSCGHFQLAPLPDAIADREFYDADLQTRNLDTRIDLEVLSKKKAHDTDRRMRFLEEAGFRPGASVLDVGSGYGMFLAEAFRRGYRAVGIEISRDRRAAASTLTGAPVLDINLLDGDHDELGVFDAVTLFQVVEHLTEPGALLERLTRRLAQDGALLVEVPNRDDAMIELSAPYGRFFWQRAHVSYFDPAGLRRVMLEAGCRRVQIHGLQRYGLGNHLHWLLRRGPQVFRPSFEASGPIRAIEKAYKRRLERRLTSDSIIAVGRL